MPPEMVPEPKRQSSLIDKPASFGVNSPGGRPRTLEIWSFEDLGSAFLAGREFRIRLEQPVADGLDMIYTHPWVSSIWNFLILGSSPRVWYCKTISCHSTKSKSEAFRVQLKPIWVEKITGNDVPLER
jgi:hypothetical protein